MVSMAHSIRIFSTRIKIRDLPHADGSDLLLQDGGVVAEFAATEAPGRTAEAGENGAHPVLRSTYKIV